MSSLNSLRSILPSLDGTADISCPTCQNHIRLDVSDLAGYHRPLKAHCGCGKTLEIVVETRIFDRKPVCLSGSYRRHTAPQGTASSSMTVENISFGGIKFLARCKHGIQQGDTLDVTFVLDNNARSEITKTVVIRHINDREVGAMFSEVQVFDTVLADYINSDLP